MTEAEHKLFLAMAHAVKMLTHIVGTSDHHESVSEHLATVEAEAPADDAKGGSDGNSAK